MMIKKLGQMEVEYSALSVVLRELRANYRDINAELTEVKEKLNCVLEKEKAIESLVGAEDRIGTAGTFRKGWTW